MNLFILKLLFLKEHFVTQVPIRLHFRNLQENVNNTYINIYLIILSEDVFRILNLNDKYRLLKGQSHEKVGEIKVWEFAYAMT
jgi:hypothetical protein